MMRSPLILSSHPICGELEVSQTEAKCKPRQDYVEIARLLGADIKGPGWLNTGWRRYVSRIEHNVRLNVAESLMVVRQLAHYNSVLSTSEKVAIPLAAAMTLKRQWLPHVVIAHRLSSAYKTYLFRLWPLHKKFAHVICVCQAQADFATRELGIPQSQVSFIHDKVDHRFFCPTNEHSESFVLAVGQEQRDYGTLLQAVGGTGLKLIVVASSPWSNNRADVRERLDNDVKVLSHVSFHRLRQLYATARIVIVPLFDVTHAAGVNTLLEAMAMAKPVIVSRTAGIKDYIVNGETGVFVTAQDAGDLRNEIMRLWFNPTERHRLGANAREVIDTRMNIDIYARQVAEIVREVKDNHE